MRAIAALIVCSLALLAGSASASTTTATGATVRIAGNGPLSIVGSGWHFKERVVVMVNVSKKVSRRLVLANTKGYWRFPVITPSLGCNRFAVTAKGPKTGTVSTARRIGTCPEVGPTS